MAKKERVLVAMSGGIDSTVTAMMLHEQGYELIGLTMKTWDYATSGGSKKESGCCSLDSINDAREVAVEMGFPHYIIDIKNEFGDHVIENFIEEYLAGRTPNPCVKCNTHIKWDALIERANALKCKYIATGHYAIVKEENGRKFIASGVDKTKDQSYVLWGLDQSCLERTIFPLGELTKEQVRKYAFDKGYEALSKKTESYEICFIPDDDYNGFLKRSVPGLEEKLANGKFVNQKGDLVGYHNGYPFFTIGQRRGLGIALGKPVYVTDIFPETNTVMIGDIDDLIKNGMVVKDFILMKYDKIPEDRDLKVMIRYNSQPVMCRAKQVGDEIHVAFLANVRGVAPGQSAVFFEGTDIVGGGIISK